MDSSESKTQGQSVLVVHASPLGDMSASSAVANAFVDAYKSVFPSDSVTVLNLFEIDLQPFTAARVQSKFATWGGQEPPPHAQAEWEYTKGLITQFKSHDKIVIATPMWNFAIPWILKLYFDHLVQPWQTFNAQDFSGLVTGKPCLVIGASGAGLLGSGQDFVFPYVKGVLKSIGFTDIRTIALNGTGNPANRANLIAAGSEEAAQAAQNFVFDPTAQVTGTEFPMTLLENQPGDFPCGDNVLVVTASPMGDYSASRNIMNAFIEDYKTKHPSATITILDIAENPLQPFSAKRVKAKSISYSSSETPVEFQSEWDYTKSLIAQFLNADTYVFALPMWNGSIPYNLKLYFDHIVQPHKTFDPATWSGLVRGKPCYVISASGVGLLGTQHDFCSSYMKVALGSIGFTDIRLININGTANQQGLPALLEGVANQMRQMIV